MSVRWVKIGNLPVKPPWKPWEAVAYAKGQVTRPYEDYHAMCDHFVASCYGYVGSGYPTAYAHWLGIPPAHRTPDGPNPPHGALVFWKGGSSGAGHVAIVVGDRQIASNDIIRDGKIDLVPLGTITAKWGQEYLGWAQPYFLGWGKNPHPKPNVPSPYAVRARLAKLVSGLTDRIRRLRRRRRHAKNRLGKG